MRNNAIEWTTYKLEETPEAVTSFLVNSRHGSTLQNPHWYLYTSRRSSRYAVVCALEQKIPIFAALIRKSNIPGTPYFSASVQRGPVFDDINNAVLLWESFEAQLLEEGLCALEVHPFWGREESKDLKDFLISRGYGRALKNRAHTATVTLDLSGSEDQLFMKLKGSRRNLIRKASKLGIVVNQVKDKTEMDKFWQMYRDMCIAKKINYWSLGKFERTLQYSLDHPRDTVCLIGTLAGEIVGGHIAMRHSDIYEVTRGGASIVPNKGVPKTDLVLWESILWAKRQGARLYDFGGITPDAEIGSPEWGVNHFKFDFSERPVYLFEPMEKIFHANIYNIHGSLKKMKRVVLKYLPDLPKVRA